MLTPEDEKRELGAFALADVHLKEGANLLLSLDEDETPLQWQQQVTIERRNLGSDGLLSGNGSGRRRHIGNGTVKTPRVIQLFRKIPPRFIESESKLRKRLTQTACSEGFTRSHDGLLRESEPGVRVGLVFITMQDELSELLGRKVDLNTPGLSESVFPQRSP